LQPQNYSKSIKLNQKKHPSFFGIQGIGTSDLKDHKKFFAQRCIGQTDYIGEWHSHSEAALDTSAIDIATNHEKVLHKLPHAIGVCVITKAILNTVFPH
jgi:hypothetical protein